MKTLCLISLGCNKNLIDSEVMLGKLSDYILVDSPKDANVTIVNTCGFIQSAKQESIEKILEVAQDKPKDSILVVSGCLSQRYANELRDEIKEIDIITGVGDYDKIDKMILDLNKNQKIIKSNATFLIDSHSRVITGSSIHAYIKLSEGCNQQCSFCAIPNIKGKLHSRSLESCLKEIHHLVEKGFYDFSFIAQDSSSYMRDLGRKDALIELIDRVEKIQGIRSARILYLYPSTTTNRLIDRIAESPIFQNYFDMPIQHITDSMLKIMRRGSDKNRHIELLKHMRKVKDSFIRTTLLIGHPGESQKDFDDICGFMSDFVFDRVNIFAFSSEEGTKAFTMPQKVNSKIIDKRINILNKIIKKQQNEIFKNYKGKTMTCIIDGISKTSEFFLSARDIKWDREIDGEILINENLTQKPLEAGYYNIKIETSKDGYLIGKAINRL
ncbi:30S ribosomal protein S12 methylthiotransferase RimO [Helicobacter sp. 16-1353]|uniref:30S ribosomal protein S12 methylthiotransferase RimO n=1 Tax=Helicobacter sp. 16-1353 TaxID=2004996 RepID=UPI000DCAED07|nr:30S ribosomal protein S12 methylthiotransferase RimO [Helicobacter sp. 16-1353]RAX54447.1 30S ribosomal protein S12 methylthiotransferase RimO [Helicobacter sp. 16-1353]